MWLKISGVSNAAFSHHGLSLRLISSLSKEFLHWFFRHHSPTCLDFTVIKIYNFDLFYTHVPWRSFFVSGIIVNLLWCILYRLVLFRILFTPSSYAAVQLLRSLRSALIRMHLESRKGLVNRMAFQMQLVVLKCFRSSYQACHLWICVCDMSVYFPRRGPMAVVMFKFFWWARVAMICTFGRDGQFTHEYVTNYAMSSMRGSHTVD